MLHAEELNDKKIRKMFMELNHWISLDDLAMEQYLSVGIARLIAFNPFCPWDN